VDDTIVDQVIEAITNVARTGKIGDGKIFVTQIAQAVRIRTGEAGAGRAVAAANPFPVCSESTRETTVTRTRIPGILRYAPALLALLAPALGFAQDAPVPDKGDTAWMLTSTVLVILMTIPGLALFYGGMSRSKNVLSLLMQVFMIFCLVSLLWAIYGYSLAFTGGNAFIGGFDRCSCRA